MKKPVDFLPDLIQYGNIAFNFLRGHLSEEQISDFLDYLHTPTITYGEAFRHITEDHGLSETVFYSLESLSRINALCNAAECPSKTPINPDQAFLSALSALRAGMMIGAISDDHGKEAIFALAKHGKKFAERVGKKDDELTGFLLSLFRSFYDSHDRYPSNKEVLNLLESKQHQGIIHSIDDEELEWGANGNTKITSLLNRFSFIRKKLRKKSR